VALSDRTAPALTPAQRRALGILVHQVGFIIGHGQLGKRDISKTTATWLIEHGLARQLSYDPDEHPTPHGGLVITTAGRKRLNEPIEEVPVYLHAIDGLTTLRSKRAAGEPDIIDPATLDPYWARQDAEKQAAAKDRREESRRLRGRCKRAA
jgi:hypothetical protein